MSLPKIDSIDLADYIIATKGNIKHIKLQKLLYYIEAYHLAFFGQSLIDDNFEAWLHGPVSRKVWEKYKSVARAYGEIPVESINPDVTSFVEKTLDLSQTQFIDDVLESLSKYSAYELEKFTHAEKPWLEARKGVHVSEGSNNIINKETMREFYKAELDEKN